MLNINFNPFPVLETERLTLSRLSNDDLIGVKKLRGNPENMKFIPRPLIKTDEEGLAHIKLINDRIDSNEAINWSISLKNKSEFIGLLGLYKIHIENFRAEIGYMILPEFKNQGIISEAVLAVNNYGFNVMNLHSIEAVIDPRNLASEKVLIKNGFVKEAHFIENEFAQGEFWDSVVYSLLKRNFKK
jgi:[ribosomal protein S5]-alanine N-acetyltransferase